MKPARRMGNFEAWADPAGVKAMQDQARHEKDSVLLLRFALSYLVDELLVLSLLH